MVIFQDLKENNEIVGKKGSVVRLVDFRTTHVLIYPKIEI